MTGMELILAGIGAAASVAGAGVAAVGSIQQGNAAQDAADYNAKVLQQQAQSEKDAANAEASDYRRQASRQMASETAARGALGVTMAGSPLMVDEATVREVALGASRITYAGQVKARRELNEASLQKMEGSAQRSAGYIGAGTSLLQGFGNAAYGLSNAV